MPDRKMLTYKDGLKDAANLLIETAEDLESSFDRRRGELERAIKNRQLGVDALRSSLNVDKEKATLLRGQATRIGELMEQQETQVPAPRRMKP